MYRKNLCIGFVLVFLCACAPSDEAIATALAETAEAGALQALIVTLTQQAMATDTPVPTQTETPLPTETPTALVTATREAPIGSYYVPDFIGMDYWEARELLEESDARWYYVELINKNYPDYQIFIQEPDPGSLIVINDRKVKIVVAREKMTPTPEPPERKKKSSGDPCEGLTFAGTCIDNVCYWCENGEIWYWDCGSGTCAWDDGYGYYTCFP